MEYYIHENGLGRHMQIENVYVCVWGGGGRRVLTTDNFDLLFLRQISQELVKI